MVQIDSTKEDSYGDLNHKLDYMVGNREHGQLVQIDRANESIPVVGQSFKVGPRPVEGIGTASAYADLDAFGGKLTFVVPLKGWITNAIFHDLDDEGLSKELYLFNQDFTAITDNNPFALSDADNLKIVAVITFGVFKDAGNNQIGLFKGEPVRYHAPSGRLWGQFQTRGADNIAAGNIPQFTLYIEE